MFSKLSFTTRIPLPPVIAAVAFLVLVFTIQALNTLTAHRLA